MHGDVTTYNAGTGALVVNVTRILGSGTFTDWTITFSAPLTNPQLISNLKPVVNGTVNLLDIFTKSGGAVPAATHIISVAIPDGNGNTFRSRNGAVASGTGQIAMADAGNYWSKGSLDGEIKTAYLYAIWSAADGGLVWALGGYSGFTRVPASVTATDDDFFLLETDSTYTKVITDYCVAVAKIRYEYDTADAPDYTIQATVLNAPQVMWNPRSDYGYTKTLANTVSSASDIADYSAVSVVVKQAGKYNIIWKALGVGQTDVGGLVTKIKTGSSTYASAVQKSFGGSRFPAQYSADVSQSVSLYLNPEDTIHGGAEVIATSGNRVLMGDSSNFGATSLTFYRRD